jgi:hypothetical protein
MGLAPDLISTLVLYLEAFMETPNARDREEAGQLRRSAGRYRDLGYPATAMLFEAEAWRLEHPGESILTLLGLAETDTTQETQNEA